MQDIKVWPHLVVIAIVVAMLAGAGVLLWTKHRAGVDDTTRIAAARLDRVDGNVGISQPSAGDAANASKSQWTAAQTNMPVSVGDRIIARENAHASVAFTGRNFARLNPNSSLDILSLTGERTQVALREGSGIFNIGHLDQGALFEVATPSGAVDLNEPGLYQIGLDDNGNAVVSVLSGLAQVAGMGDSGRISQGETLTLAGQDASDAVLSNFNTADAGSVVDEYYGYQYPRKYDGRYRDYAAYQSDPYYYDPYNRYTSYQYVSDWIPGVEDLDDYGYWQNIGEYGECWHPNVASGWAPYQEGYWYTQPSYGLTWVSYEPWGYAPYHYGRWASYSNQWYWIPERVHTQPSYAPALVAFIPFTQSNEIGWVPLGPGDRYAPRYYDSNWQTRYLTNQRFDNKRIANLAVPGAVTVVEARNFQQPIDRRVREVVNPQQLARVRPVFDPMSDQHLRQAAFQTSGGQHRIQIPDAVAKRIDNTPVITGSAPNVTPFRQNVAKDMRVQTINPQQNARTLQTRDTRQSVASSQPGDSRRTNPGQSAGAPATAPIQTPDLRQTRQTRQMEQRQQRIDALSARSSAGDQNAQRQVQQLQKQQDRAQQVEARRQAATQQRAVTAQANNEKVQRLQPAQGERTAQRIQGIQQSPRPAAANNSPRVGIERRNQRQQVIPQPPQNTRQPHAAVAPPSRRPAPQQQGPPRAFRQPQVQSPRAQAPARIQSAPRPARAQPAAPPARPQAPAARPQAAPRPAPAGNPGGQGGGGGGGKRH